MEEKLKPGQTITLYERSVNKGIWSYREVTILDYLPTNAGPDLLVTDKGNFAESYLLKYKKK